MNNVRKLKITDFKLDKSGKVAISEVGSFDGSKRYSRTFSVSQDTTNKKQLLGFECFKLKAVEHQLDSQTGEIENYIYEMWVTDKIALPAYVPIPFCSAVTDWCALECTLTTEKMPNTYTLYRAILLSENLPAGKLQIPDWAK